MSQKKITFETNPAWGHIPPHRYHVFLCSGARCLEKGARALWIKLRQQAYKHGLIEVDGGVLFTVTHCQYPCNLGPILTVYPDGVWYRVQTEQDVTRIVQEHFIQGHICEDLLVQEEKTLHAE